MAKAYSLRRKTDGQRPPFEVDVFPTSTSNELDIWFHEMEKEASSLLLDFLHSNLGFEGKVLKDSVSNYLSFQSAIFDPKKKGNGYIHVFFEKKSHYEAVVSFESMKQDANLIADFLEFIGKHSELFFFCFLCFNVADEHIDVPAIIFEDDERIIENPDEPAVGENVVAVRYGKEKLDKRKNLYYKMKYRREKIAYFLYQDDYFRFVEERLRKIIDASNGRLFMDQFCWCNWYTGTY